MKRAPSDVDSILRWRDRPEGGGSDEDRAAALVRDALAPGAFPVGLDDRQLAAIADGLKAERRARPPFWIRPALVAALLTVSVASVLGYETAWFAPVRERLRFRAIPPVTPGPVEHAKKRDGHSPAATGEQASDTSAAPANDPVPELPAAESQPTLAPTRVIPHAALAKTGGAAPRRRLALADDRPPSPPPPASEPPQPPQPSEEVQTLQRAMGLLRGKHDARAALAALDDYVARFPGGVLAPEARVARIDALLLLDRSDEALRALETLPLDAHRRSTELQLIRGELRARTDCGRANADFTAVLAAVRTASLEERALYGRAACRSSQGDRGGTADDLRRYVDRFPTGAHADWARRWLQNNH
jgi:TolA-binding protein